MVFWQWTRADNRVVLSDAATEVLGLLPGEAIESPAGFRPLVYADDVPAYRAIERAAVSGSAFTGEYRVVRPVDGDVVWIESRGSGLPDASGQVERVVGVLTDVTARRRGEALVWGADDEALARLSHDLRAPLAALRMWVGVLRSGRPEDRGAAIEAIDRSARDQARVITERLDRRLAGLKSGR